MSPFTKYLYPVGNYASPFKLAFLIKDFISLTVKNYVIFVLVCFITKFYRSIKVCTMKGFLSKQ